MANLPPPAPPIDDLDLRKGLLDVHLFEYSALTTRITYWIAIQYGLFGLAGAYLGFAVQASSRVTVPTLVLTSVLVLEVLTWAVLQTQYEIFNTAHYIESHLKPKVALLVGSDNSFWGWEPYLDSQRAKGYIHFEWKWASLLLVLMFGLAVLLWFPISAMTRGRWVSATYSWYFWGLADLYVFVLLVLKARSNLGMGKQIVSSDSVPKVVQQRSSPTSPDADGSTIKDPSHTATE